MEGQRVRVAGSCVRPRPSHPLPAHRDHSLCVLLLLVYRYTDYLDWRNQVCFGGKRFFSALMYPHITTPDQFWWIHGCGWINARHVSASGFYERVKRETPLVERETLHVSALGLDTDQSRLFRSRGVLSIMSEIPVSVFVN